MLSINEKKYYSSLKVKKYRTVEKKFIAEGKRLVEEGLNSSYNCELIVFTEQFANQFPDFVATFPKKTRNEIISEKDFSKFSETKNPQGVAAVFDIPAIKHFRPTNLVVALENIADPGNLGTILRTADWFGLNDIIINSDSADIYNSKVVRSSMGALFHCNVYQSDEFYEILKGMKSEYKLLIADLGGNNLFETDSDKKSVLVMCNEANGPTQEIKELATDRITIPRFGKAESLNVASAAAIIIGHFAK